MNRDPSLIFGDSSACGDPRNLRCPDSLERPRRRGTVEGGSKTTSFNRDSLQPRFTAMMCNSFCEVSVRHQMSHKCVFSHDVIRSEYDVRVIAVKVRIC